MCRWVVIFPALDKFKELFRATFLKEAHERGLDGLHLGARDLGDLAVAVHERTSDLLELEVASDIGVNQYLGELAGRDDELGDKVDRVVAVASKLRWWSAIAEFAIELQMNVSYAFL